MPSVPATATDPEHPSISLKVTVHESLQKARRSLRQDTPTRNTVPEGEPSLGRAYRLGPRAGEELAHHGVRLAHPVGRLCRRPSTNRREEPSCHGLFRWTISAAQAVAPATADFRPTDPQVAWHLARFIEQTRSIPADPIIVRQNWLRAYEWTTDRGAAALNDYARANDPFTKVGKQQIAVEVSSVIRASPDSFRVAGQRGISRTASSPRPSDGQRS